MSNTYRKLRINGQTSHLHNDSCEFLAKSWKSMAIFPSEWKVQGEREEEEKKRSFGDTFAITSTFTASKQTNKQQSMSALMWEASVRQESYGLHIDDGQVYTIAQRLGCLIRISSRNLLWPMFTQHFTCWLEQTKYEHVVAIFPWIQWREH